MHVIVVDIVTKRSLLLLQWHVSAGVAQMVEQAICTRQVRGSSPRIGFSANIN